MTWHRGTLVLAAGHFVKNRLKFNLSSQIVSRMAKNVKIISKTHSFISAAKRDRHDKINKSQPFDGLIDTEAKSLFSFWSLINSTGTCRHVLWLDRSFKKWAAIKCYDDVCTNQHRNSYILTCNQTGSYISPHFSAENSNIYIKTRGEHRSSWFYMFVPKSSQTRNLPLMSDFLCVLEL